MEGAWTAPAGAASGLRVLHSTMHGHCLPATQVRAFHGYLPGAARKCKTFTVNNSPATVKFEQDPANLAVTRVHLSAPAVWAVPHTCHVEAVCTVDRTGLPADAGHEDGSGRGEGCGPPTHG